MNSTIAVSSLSEFIQKIIEFPNFMFARGEPQKYDKPFLPSVWRPDNDHIDRTPVSASSCYSIGELEVIRKVQNEVQSGKLYDPYFQKVVGSTRKKIRVDSESLWHWTALAQHYGHPTRLVDVTSDCLAALYFATETHDDLPGYVHIFRDNFNHVNRNNIHHVEFGESFFDLIAIKDSPNDAHPIKPNDGTTAVISPSFPNRRVEAQKGLFCFTRKIGAQAYWGGQLSFEISNKKQIRGELLRLGYCSESIYPEELDLRAREGFCSRIKNLW